MAFTKSNWPILLLTILVTINIGLTSYVAFRPSVAVTTTPSAAVPDSVISEAEATSLAKDLIPLYNNQDVSGLYQRFDALARVQFSEKQLSEQLIKLVPSFGTVNDFAYSYANISGTDAGRTFYTLHYKVQLSGAAFEHGDLTLTVTKKDKGLALFGFFINSSTRSKNQ